MGTRSAEEVWERLVAEAGDDEIERAASVSVAQAAKELAEAGFDVAAERARAETLIDELEGTAPRRPGVSAPAAGVERGASRRRVSSVAWAGAAAAAAAAGIAVTYSAMNHEQRGESGSPPRGSASTSAPSDSAADLRRRAVVACDAGQAKECLALLDEARAIDAVGDGLGEIQRLRARAVDALRRKAP